MTLVCDTDKNTVCAVLIYMTGGFDPANVEEYATVAVGLETRDELFAMVVLSQKMQLEGNQLHFLSL